MVSIPLGTDFSYFMARNTDRPIVANVLDSSQPEVAHITISANISLAKASHDPFLTAGEDG